MNDQNSSPDKLQVAVLAALSSVAFIMVLGNSLLIPVLPEIKSALRLTQLEVSLLITLFSVPAGLVIPLAGFLSDRYGRKKVIIPSLILYGLGGVLAGLTALSIRHAAFSIILLARVLQGIGAAGTAPVAMAFCGDLFTGKQRPKALGIIEAANGFGKVVSPVLGALLGLLSWYAAFFFFPLAVVPVVLGIWLLTKESVSRKPDQGMGQYLKSFLPLFEKKSVLLLSSFFGGMTALLLLFGVLFFLSDYLEAAFHYGGIKKGAVLAIPVLFLCVTSYITGMFFIKKNVLVLKWLVACGLAVIAAALASLGIFKQIVFFFAAISLIGAGAGLVLPCLNTIITSVTASEKRGLVTALYGGVRFWGVAIGPPLFGLLMKKSELFMFLGAALLAAAAFLAAAFFIRTKEITIGGQNSTGK